MTDLPTAEDYLRAVQDPGAFTQPRLRAAELATHPLLGIPIPASGTSAIVFKATVEGRPQALRFLTRADAADRQRYTELNRYFAERRLSADVAAVEWVDDAITVNGRTWPMVQMQWVDGRTLNHHLEQLVTTGDAAAIDALAARWRRLLHRMQAARFAHGDLQHGNVMVEGDGTLRMVDFDSAWIEPFAGSPPPPETGHRNYQRPGRPWGPWMDTFPGLVIYLSLLALARDPAAWERLHTGENLLFRSEDFAPPYDTAAWTRIAQLGDPELDALSGRLRACCAPAWTAAADLETVLADPVPWWVRTGGVRPEPPARPAAEVTPVPAADPGHPGPTAPGGTWWDAAAPAAAAAAAPAAGRPQRRWSSIVLISLSIWVLAIAVTSARLAPVAAAAAGLVPAVAGFAALAAGRRAATRTRRAP